MEECIEKTISHYATMVLEWLDLDSKQYKVRRSNLVDMFVDTLQALEQWKSQED